MRGLRLTVFATVFLSLTAQLMRHSYVRWIQSHASVLDKYETVDKEIKEAKSLDDLERRYAEEVEKEKRGETNRDARSPEPEPKYRFRQAIAQWEHAQNQMRELRYYCVAGVICLALAVLLHVRGLEWLSIMLQIAGFAEMTWWTSPAWAGPYGLESARLLDNKIAFATLALGLLLIFWFTGLLAPRDE